MSPRHFSKLLLNSSYNRELKSRDDLGPNLWFAFTRVTGIADLFVYTPKKIKDQEQANGSGQGPGYKK